MKPEKDESRPRRRKAAPEISTDERDAITDHAINQARARCVRLLKAHLGPGGYQLFLLNRQPALGERTGNDLLLNDPAMLLERLEMLEGGSA